MLNFSVKYLAKLYKRNTNSYEGEKKLANQENNEQQPTATTANGGSTSNHANAVAAVKEAVANDEFESIILRGEAEAVKLEGIEKGLTNLWQVAAKPRPGETEPPVTRACVLNLIAFAEDRAQLTLVTEVITKLTWSYPCRALVLVSEPNSQSDTMQAWISTHCQQPTPSAKKVCCEQITVEGRGQSSERLASLVLPLLVPDLPVITWWSGNPPSSGYNFDHLLNTTDRFISDSSDFSDYTSGLSKLAELVETNPRLVVSDFNWTRLTPWRSFIAQFFDEPHLLPYLYNIDNIEIEYVMLEGTEQPNLAMGLLLVGWLACKLGWLPAFGLKKRGRSTSIILNQNGRPLNVEFKPIAQPLNREGCISSVKIDASANEQEAIFAVSLAETGDLAYAMIEENNHPNTRQVMLPKRDMAALLVEELHEITHDNTYEECLLMVADIINNNTQRTRKANASAPSRA
jgi:glucose-6-phosphate dehydrogenase assembly protein OpcA